MNRFTTWGGPILLCLAVAAIAHVGAVVAAPGLIMNKAMKTLSLGGARINVWTHGARSSPHEQYVVRPSPDLAYSACVWDLGEGPIRVTAPAWPGYYSLSIFNDNTDNFFVANDRATGPSGVDVVLVVASQQTGLKVPAGSRVVVAPSRRGVALLRYLAPTEAEFARADAARRGAICAPLLSEKTP